ncbi:hypothetical protein OAL26_00790 [Flavobacteriales bacterium]|nr:hypothetical protein [Flavobacteriales bacterium]
MIKWMSLILIVVSLSSCVTLSLGSTAPVNLVQPAVGHYSNGQLRFKGEYYNGYRHGKWTDWNGNGDTISIVNYDQGELSGSFKIWELEKSYENNSESIPDYAKDYGEIIIKEGYYLDGNINGGFEVSYSSGRLKESGSYNKGRKDGEWTKLNSMGDTLHIINYSLGDRKGPFTIWSYYSHEMLNDAMRNIIKIKHRGIYKFSRLNGNYVESFPNGKVKCAGAYIEDNREGDWTWYFETGIIKETAVYKLGQLISSEKFEETNGN